MKTSKGCVIVFVCIISLSHLTTNVFATVHDSILILYCKLFSEFRCQKKRKALVCKPILI